MCGSEHVLRLEPFLHHVQRGVHDAREGLREHAGDYVRRGGSERVGRDEHLRALVPAKVGAARERDPGDDGAEPAVETSDALVRDYLGDCIRHAAVVEGAVPARRGHRALHLHLGLDGVHRVREEPRGDAGDAAREHDLGGGHSARRLRFLGAISHRGERSLEASPDPLALPTLARAKAPPALLNLETSAFDFGLTRGRCAEVLDACSTDGLVILNVCYVHARSQITSGQPP